MNNSQKQELLEYYKNLLILQYNQQNGTARATIGALVDQVLGALVAQQVQDGFNVETAIGNQLDILAKYLGLQRYQQGYGNLTDDELRVLIKFAILKNNNLSSLEAITDSLYALFGNEISVVDYKNMTMRYNISSKIDEVVIDILRKTDLLPRPMGVGVEILYIDEVLGFAGSELQTFDNGVFYDPESQIVQESTLTINCDEPGVKIIINNTETRTKKMETGSGYTWSVSKDGLQTASGSGTLTEDTIIDISVLKVQPSVSQATVIINDVEQDGILFVTGTTLNYTYSVSAPGYGTVTGSGTVTSTYTVLVALGYTLTINAPYGAIVTINGEETNFVSLPSGTAYTWTVSGTGYLTASGSGTLTQSTVLNVYTVMGTNALFNFNNSGKSIAYALEGSTISYQATYGGYIPYSGTKTITSNTVINMATLTAEITPTPDTLTINGSSGNIALFEDGVDFSYTIAAQKTGYQNFSMSGTVNETSTVTGSMTVIYPSFSATYASTFENNSTVYEAVIPEGAEGNYTFTIKGGSGSSGQTSSIYGNPRYYGTGRGGVATGKVYLAAGTKISFQRIGAIRPTKASNDTASGNTSNGNNGIGLYINNVLKLVAGGGGQGSVRVISGSGSAGQFYFFRNYYGGGGGYGGGLGQNSGNGLNYDGTTGNSTAQTSGTPYGGHGGTSNTSSGTDTTAHGGNGYKANDFSQGSQTSAYRVISLTCTGGSNWRSGSSGNSGSASITFKHE